MVENAATSPIATAEHEPFVIAPTARIGHIHLKVADLERAIGFYHGVLGFEIVTRYCDQAAFLSAGGYHHHIGLNTWESKGGRAPAPGTTGLYHTASSTQREKNLPRRCVVWCSTVSHSVGHRTTESARHSTSTIRTATGSNSTGIDQKTNGHGTRTATSRCSPGGSICRNLSPCRSQPAYSPEFSSTKPGRLSSFQATTCQEIPSG